MRPAERTRMSAPLMKPMSPSAVAATFAPAVSPLPATAADTAKTMLPAMSARVTPSSSASGALQGDQRGGLACAADTPARLGDEAEQAVETGDRLDTRRRRGAVAADQHGAHPGGAGAGDVLLRRVARV